MITNIFPFIHPIDTAENQSLVSNIKFSFLSYVVLNWMGHIYISRIACFSTIRTHPYIKRNYFSINLIFAYSLSRFYLSLKKLISQCFFWIIICLFVSTIYKYTKKKIHLWYMRIRMHMQDGYDLKSLHWSVTESKKPAKYFYIHPTYIKSIFEYIFL